MIEERPYLFYITKYKNVIIYVMPQFFVILSKTKYLY